MIDTAKGAITLSRDITHIRQQDMEKVHMLGKSAAESAVVCLRNLYKLPIVDLAKIQEWTGFSTRSGAQKVIDRFIDLGILVQRDPAKTYGRTYEYRSYLSLFDQLPS